MTLALLTLTLVSPAFAQEVPRLDERIVDRAGVLTADQRQEAEDALADAEQEGVQLFVQSQESAFTSAGQVWAPRYRQAAFGAFLKLWTERLVGELAVELSVRRAQVVISIFHRVLE